MSLDSVPIIGQLGIIGIPLIIVVWVIYAIMRGDLVARKQVEQIQAMADTFRQAFEVAQGTAEKQSGLLESLTTTSETLQKLLDSMPPEPHINPDTTTPTTEHNSNEKT